MNRCVVAAVVIAAIGGGTPPALLAGGMRLASQDGFASGRGEAFAATADNASAVYYNPAGLAQLKGHHVRAGLYGIYLDPTYTRPAPANTNTYHIENKLAAVPQFFYACGLQNVPVTFGLGVYSPYGLSASWPQDTGFRAVALEGALTYVTIHPAVAVELGPGVSVGAGVTVNYVDMILKQGLRPAELPLVNYFRFAGEGWSLGYNLGALWQVHETVSVGVCFRSSAKVRLEGGTDFEQQPVIPETRRPANAEFEFPLGAVFGISWRPTRQWNLEFNADYTDWSSFDSVTMEQTGPAPPWPVKQSIPVQLRWRPSWMYEFGATRYLQKGWHVSAGYVFSENSVPDTYYTPLAADMDRHFFSLGAGRKGKTLDLDVTYQFGYGPNHTVTGSTPSSTPGQFAGQTADGTYDFISHAILVTMGMRF